MSASRALQKALKAKIDAASLGVTVYDGAPVGTVPPFIEFGSSDFGDENAECITMREQTIQIDVWRRDQGQLHPTRYLTDLVYDAVHEASLTLDDPYACIDCRVTLVQVFLDRDGITAHGVVQVTALIETVA